MENKTVFNIVYLVLLGILVVFLISDSFSKAMKYYSVSGYVSQIDDCYARKNESVIPMVMCVPAFVAGNFQKNWSGLNVTGER